MTRNFGLTPCARRPCARHIGTASRAWGVVLVLLFTATACTLLAFS